MIEIGEMFPDAFFFLGLFGGHQLYLGKVGVLIDLFTMGNQVTEVNRKAGIKVTYSSV